MDDSISIRQLTTYGEFLVCEEIQRLAWKMSDERDVVPAHMLKPVAEHGGIVLGAFNAEPRLVGFVFGFVGRVDDVRREWMGTPNILCSEMMGVLPEYRSKAVGYRLKLAQRDYALAQGYRLVVWTYDPLLSLNANLNISKLGAICRSYVEDAYGKMGGIYAGVSTDRFAVEWWIASERVTARTRTPGATLSADAWLKAGVQVVNPARLRKDGLLEPCEADLNTHAPRWMAEIPADFQGLKQADPQLAREWRSHTRSLFEAAFAQGYVVAWFARGSERHPQSSYYILTNQMDIQSLAGENYED